MEKGQREEESERENTLKAEVGAGKSWKAEARKERKRDKGREGNTRWRDGAKARQWDRQTRAGTQTGRGPMR